MSIEKRKHERKPVRMDLCEGTFTLEMRNGSHEIPEIRDISLSGVGITMPIYVDPGRPVKIYYAEGDHVISASGTVTWCQEKSLSAGQFDVGIFFDDPYRDANHSFYVTMNKYLA